MSSPEETEAAIWSQLTGLPVTAVHHRLPVWDNEDGSISYVAIYGSTVDGHKLVPGDRVELELEGGSGGPNGVYTVSMGDEHE